MFKEKEDLELFAWIGNLGKYGEGELLGDWIRFPATNEELEDFFKRIKVSNKADEDGNIYDEYFIADYDGNIPSEIRNELSEFESIENLQILGTLFDRISEQGMIDTEIFNGLLEYYDCLDAMANYFDDNYYFYADVNNEYDLGNHFVDEFGGIEYMDKHTLEMYFNYAGFGRDLHLEYYAEEGEAETIREFLGLPLWATDREVGAEYVDMLGGISEVDTRNLESYFDYEAYGRDIQMEGSYIFIDYGVIDCRDCETGIGYDLYENTKEELIADGLIEEKLETSRDEEER